MNYQKLVKELSKEELECILVLFGESLEAALQSWTCLMESRERFGLPADWNTFIRQGVLHSLVKELHETIEHAKKVKGKLPG